MKKSFIVGTLALILVLTVLIYSFVLKSSFKDKTIIKVYDYQIANFSGCGDALNLFDEFEPNGFTPKSFFKPSLHGVCKESNYQVSIFLDRARRIDNLHVFADSFFDIKFKIGTKETDVQLHYGWNKVEINTTASSISIEFSGNSAIGEIVMEGDNSNSEIKKINHKYPTIRELVGMNAFVDDALGAIAIVDHIRAYHEISWNINENLQTNFNPSYPGFDFDPLFTSYSKSQKTICPVIQHSLKKITAHSNAESKPCLELIDCDQEMSYETHAQLIGKIFNNYYITSNIQCIEHWNEPEKFWHGKESFINPKELFAMGVATKKILDSTKNNSLVMPGLTDIKTDYINALYALSESKGVNFPWSVINVHLYCNNPELKIAISPEEFNLQTKIKRFVEACKAQDSNANIWLSEFGYDKNDDKSPQKVPNIAGVSRDITQANWLLRSLLLLSSTGLDKAYQYMARDTKGKDTYASCGLYKTENGTNRYFPSWHYVKSFVGLLGNYRFSMQHKFEQNEEYCYEYIKGKSKIYAVWLGTSTNSQMKAPEKLKKILKNGRFLYTPSATGSFIRKSLNLNELTISETPLFVTDTIINQEIIGKVSSDQIVLNSTTGQLFDEQEGADPAYQPGKAVNTTIEQKVIEIELKETKNIKFISIFDDQGVSELSIYAVNNNIKTLIFTGKLNQYKKWKSLIVEHPASKIIIEQPKNTSKIGEVVLYETHF